jgi:hypothetical protein
VDSLLAILIRMAVVALFAGTVAYLVFRRDLGRRGATFGAGLTVGASFLFVLYLGVVAFLAFRPTRRARQLGRSGPAEARSSWRARRPDAAT